MCIIDVLQSLQQEDLQQQPAARSLQEEAMRLSVLLVEVYFQQMRLTAMFLTLPIRSKEQRVDRMKHVYGIRFLPPRVNPDRLLESASQLVYYLEV